MRKFITINTTRFPLVVARCKPFAPTLEELRDAQMDVEELAHNYKNFVLIVDLTELRFVPPEYRSAQAKWSEKTEALFASRQMRLAFYTPSSIARIMLKGVFLMREPAVPHIVVSALEQAFAWGQKQMLLQMAEGERRKFVIIDHRRFPLVIVRYQQFTPTPEEFELSQLELEDFAQKNRDFVIIIDQTHFRTMPYKLQFSMAKWIYQDNSVFIENNIQVVCCEPSPIRQTILKLLLLIYKPGIRQTVVDSIDQGLRWASNKADVNKQKTLT